MITATIIPHHFNVFFCTRVIKQSRHAQSPESAVAFAGRALGKCVSASALAPPRAGPRAAPPRLSRSAQALAPGYILRARGAHLDITKVTARCALKYFI